MLEKLRDFFAAPPADDVDKEAALHLAAAMLLIEVAKVDHSLDAIELDRMRSVLAKEWGLGESELNDLVAVARDSSETSVSLHEHVDLINRNFTPEQKFDLVRGMWQVACADDQIHHHEEALIRRLADLLYVSHSDFICSKLKVLDDA